MHALRSRKVKHPSYFCRMLNATLEFKMAIRPGFKGCSGKPSNTADFGIFNKPPLAKRRPTAVVALFYFITRRAGIFVRKRRSGVVSRTILINTAKKRGEN